MAVNINDFRNKERYLEPDRVWTKNLQYKEGYIYATNYHIIARVKGERPVLLSYTDKEQRYEAFFETSELIGTVERKAVNKLLPFDDEFDNKLKLHNRFFQKKYLKKMFKAGGAIGELHNSKMPNMFILKFEEIEFAFMALENNIVEMEGKEIPIIKPEEQNG